MVDGWPGRVQYIVDEHGRRKAVIISYRAYRRLMEDIADLRCIEERKNEEAIPLEEVLKELRDAGRI